MTTLRSNSLDRITPGDGRVANIPGRFVEEGILMIPKRVSFVLRFQGFPSWILALDRTVVKQVTFVDWSSPSELIQWITNNKLSASMVNAAIAHIGLGKVRYGATFDADAIWLISGSVDYVVAQDWSLGCATLVLVS
jgi:hypothetical protein